MRKIINGRVYNTATSKMIGEWWNGYHGSDFRCCYETLYKNTKGAYFIHGEGGPMTKYAKSYGNEITGSEEIIPMSYEEARDWAERNLRPDEYEAEFGEIEEADPESDLVNRERVNLTLDSEIISKLRKLSKKKGTPMSRMVDEAITAMYSEEFKNLD